MNPALGLSSFIEYVNEWRDAMADEKAGSAKADSAADLARMSEQLLTYTSAQLTVAASATATVTAAAATATATAAAAATATATEAVSAQVESGLLAASDAVSARLEEMPAPWLYESFSSSFSDFTSALSTAVLGPARTDGPTRTDGGGGAVAASMAAVSGAQGEGEGGGEGGGGGASSEGRQDRSPVVD